MTDMTAEQAMKNLLRKLSKARHIHPTAHEISLMIDLAHIAGQALTAPRVPDVVDRFREASEKGFSTSESCGPDGKYQSVTKFRSLADLQEYERARTAMLAAAPAPADSEQLKCNTCGESTDDPWHYSLVGNRHLHACDACWRSVNPANDGKIVPLMERVAELESHMRSAVLDDMADGFYRPTAEFVKAARLQAEQVTKVGAMKVTHDADGRVSKVNCPMPLFTTTEGEEVKRLRERVSQIEKAYDLLSEEYEDRRAQWGNDYLWRKHEDADAVSEAARLRGGSNE